MKTIGKRLSRALLLAVVGALILGVGVLASYTQYIPLNLTENAVTSYSMVPVIATVDNEYLYANGYFTNALNTGVTGNSGSLPWMLTAGKTLYAQSTSIGASYVNRYVLNNSDAAANTSVITGQNGYLITADAAGLEPGNNFSIETNGYVNTAPNSSLAYALAETAGAVFTDETTAANNATANDMHLLSNTPAATANYLFGSATPFNELQLNIGTAGVGTWTITWQYWNGASWTALSGIVDNTRGYLVSGTNMVSWTAPSSWSTNVVNSDTAYWVRADVSAYTSISTAPLGTQAWLVSTIAIKSSNTIQTYVDPTTSGKIYSILYGGNTPGSPSTQTAGSSVISMYGGTATRIAQAISASTFAGNITAFQFKLSKAGGVGLPTGTITCNVRNYNTDAVLGTLGTMLAQNLTGTPTYYAFNSTPVLVDNLPIRISIEYSGGDSSNYVNVSIDAADAGEIPVGQYSSYTGAAWADNASWDVMYQGWTWTAVSNLTLSATGVSSTAHDIIASANATNFVLTIDGVQQGSIALSGVSVMDTNNSWTWGSIATPYFTWIKESVSSTEVLNYAPTVPIGDTAYSTGSVSGTSGSTTLTGSGTTWTTAMVFDLVKLTGDATYYQITQFIDTSHVFITPALGTSPVAVVYNFYSAIPNNDATKSYYGVPTWGSNPSDLTLSVSPMVTLGTTTAAVTTTQPQVVQGISGVPQATATVAVNTNFPLYGIFNIMAVMLGVQTITMVNIGAIFLLFAVGVGCITSRLGPLMTGLAMCIIAVVLEVAHIFDYWMVFMMVSFVALAWMLPKQTAVL